MGYLHVSDPLNSEVYLKVFHTGLFTGTRLQAGPGGTVEIIPTEPFDCSKTSPPPNDFTNNTLEAADDIFEMYPNPANKQVIVRLNNPSNTIENISVTDMTGRHWKTHWFSSNDGTYTITTDHLSDGLYYVAIKSTDKVKATTRILSLCHD